MQSSEKVSEHYKRLYEYFRLTWGEYFHYGIFEKSEEDLDSAQIRTLDRLAQHVRFSPNTRVLDVGSGLGASAFFLSTKYGCQVVGIDPVSDQVNFSVNKARFLQLESRVSFQLGKAEKLPFKTEEFDVVLGNEVFCHVMELEVALKECHRVLKKEGRLLLSDIISLGPKTDNSDFFYDYTKQVRIPDSVDRYKEKLTSAGFEIQVSEDQSPNFRMSYKAALRRILQNKDQIEKKYGENEYQKASTFYHQCLNAKFLREIGWAIFIGSKI